MTVDRCPHEQVFDLPIQPCPKGRPRVYRNRAVTPERTKQAEQDIGWLLRAAGARLYAAGVPLRVQAIFYFRRPKKGSVWHVRRPDGDNLVKLLMDAAEGVLWTNDSQVVSWQASKTYDDKAHIWLCVTQLGKAAPDT